jgi:hypothetical protein
LIDREGRGYNPHPSLFFFALGQLKTNSEVFMKKLTIIFACVFALFVVAEAQKKVKPWTEWSEKEVNKMLNESSWGQTQTETNTSEMFFTPTSQRDIPIGNRPLDDPSGSGRSGQGALNQAVKIDYRIRFLTAKPIRQALARRMLSQKPELGEQLKAFAEQQNDQYIVVIVDFDCSDRRFSGPAMQVFNSATTSVLKNSTYLETNDNKRLFLQDYRLPGDDGMGAKFIFPRTLNNEAFVNEKSSFIRFYSEMTKDLKLNMRFKIADMMYDGKLEY